MIHLLETLKFNHINNNIQNVSKLLGLKIENELNM